MHKRLIGRLGRREGVGFVQEGADGDAGHYCLVLSSWRNDVRLLAPAGASRRALRNLHAAWASARLANESLRSPVLADRQGTDARKVDVGEFCFFGPGVEGCLHLGEVAL